ncbi:MAG TPA: ATP-binding protein, partial [Gemmatimonadaceae bacterium]|nr:ATP-binding protein [Gemmatimonadaceae bacterium]
SEDAAEVARQLAKAPAEALVKVCREAVVNAAKHGGSCRVMVSLDVVAGKRLRLAVVDDGPGLRKAKRTGHGLVSMRRTLERQGGKLALRSGARGGVSVTASIPI